MIVNGKNQDTSKPYGCGGQNRFGIPFWLGFGAPPILVEIGMLSGGAIWILTHGHIVKGGGPPNL